MSRRQIGTKRIVQKVLCLLAALILAISLTVAYFCIESITGFYSRNNVVEALTKSNFAEKAYGQFQNKATGLLTNAFFDPAVLTEAYSQERFSDDFMESVTSALKGKPFAPDVSQGQEKIAAALKEDEKGKDPFVVRAKELVIDEISAEIAEYYGNYTGFDFGTFFYKYREAAAGIIKAVLPITILAGLIAAELIWLMNRRKHRALRYYLYAAAAAVLVNVIMCIGVLSGVSIVPSQSTAAYQDFVNELGHAALLPVFFVIAAGFILVTILAMVYKYERKKVC